MTPYEITMLIDIYVSPDFPSAPETPLRAETLANFLHSGLIKPCESVPRGYIATDRLGVFIDAICNLQLPVQTWQMPKD
jgi:hypothetical protein